MITNGSITIYNRYLDRETRMHKYKRTVLEDVYIEQGEALSARAGSSLRPDDKAFVIIHAMNREGYVSPKEFRPHTHQDSWTLKVEDTIVLQAVEDEIESIAQLESKYDDVFKITAVGWFNAGTPRMHHWEVTAK